MTMKCPKCQHENPDDTIYCGKCTTPLKPPEDLGVTETIEAPKEELTRGITFADRYEIIEELGKGGMGRVYRVEDKKTKEEIAIKLIRPEVAADKKMIDRFRNELTTARKIRHKNICGMYDLGEHKGTHYITMEYVSGEDLKSLGRRVTFDTGTTIKVAKQVCEGLTEAHRLGVVHRDLKPSNIMIDAEGNAHIMDFGIARSLETKGITGAGVMIGTPEYMSPEQAEVKEVDQRSDIYSLGVILYEMATGKVPFEGETPLGIAMKHKSEMPKDPREINAQIPEDLSQMILRCMEKDKGKRYQSAGEVRSELDKIEKGVPTTERVVSKRKPITSREITVTFGLKKLFIPALVIAAIVIIMVVIWQPWSQKEAIPFQPDKPSLAIVYFENNSGDKGLDNWRSGFAELLIADLSQSKFIDVLSGDRIFSILQRLKLLDKEKYSSEELVKIVDQAGANYLLKGSYIKTGDNFLITAVLQKPRIGDIISSRNVECREEEIMLTVDELTKQIKQDMNLSQNQIEIDVDKSVGQITTSFPEAYKYFSEAWKYHLKGDYIKTIPFYKRAIDIDPEFAIAFRMLSWIYSHLGFRSEYRKCIQKAFELSDRVSDRERYLIEGDFYFLSEKTYDKAIEAYNKLLQIDPESGLGNNMLGVTYNRVEMWDKAIERFEVNIQNKHEAYFPYANQAHSFRAKGMYEEARNALDFYLNNISDHPGIHRALGTSYLCQGKYDLALDEADKAISLDPLLYTNFRLKGDILALKGELVDAEKEYMELLTGEAHEPHFYGRISLGKLYILQGKFDEAMNEVKKGIEMAKKTSEKAIESELHLNLAYMYQIAGNFGEALNACEKAWDAAVEADHLEWQRSVLHLRGTIQIRMGSIDETRKTCDELKTLIESSMNSKKMRMHHHLVGMIELDRENYSEAIDNFKNAISLLPFQRSTGDRHAMFIDPLALAYYKSRDFEKAQKEYENITQLTVGRLNYGDIYAKSFYMLGKIYEQQGERDKAIEHYEKFLSLWKDADPGIAEVEDAGKRLAGLNE